MKLVPKRGTIIPKMSTHSYRDNLSETLFGKTRRAVLSLLYSHIDDAFYLRQIVRTAGVGLGAVQRELKQLSDAGIIQRIVRGRQVYYQADPQCPVFAELKALVMKTVGIGGIVQAALAPLADRIRIAAIYGSIARSEEHRGSDVDLLVVGEATFAEVVSALDQAQSTLNREINPTVYPIGEFQSKLSAGHHFLSTIVGKPMFFLIGDQRELARLAEQSSLGSDRNIQQAEFLRRRLLVLQKNNRNLSVQIERLTRRMESNQWDLTLVLKRLAKFTSSCR